MLVRHAWKSSGTIICPFICHHLKVAYQFFLICFTHFLISLPGTLHSTAIIPELMHHMLLPHAATVSVVQEDF
jgi:hypothetical protein